ncbi:hypothetical protein [Halalkalibacter akibai]|uniref:hypothetical protein n=1 Tax=Halalkalibacter akibai TaxID=1411 RepID=UPI0005537393|nr:hypothetical protein [Halalkalibacter akibai]
MKKKKYRHNEIVRACECGQGQLRYRQEEATKFEYVKCDWFLCDYHWDTKSPLHVALSISLVTKSE